MVRSAYKSHGGPRKPLAIRLREGVRVNVLLPKENSWFTGAVLKYDTKKALHTIANEFGDAKRVDLRAVKWKLDGIEECTEADIEAALDKGRRWHKSQSAEFLESMTSPTVSPREGPRRSSEEGGWDPSRLRVRKEHKEWYSSSEGESGGNGEVCSMGEEDEFMDGETDSYGPPALVKISNDGCCKSGHLDFELGEANDDSVRDFCSKFGAKQRGRKRSLAVKPDASVLKRPVGRPPKERKGYAAIKYAQDVAAHAIGKMAQDKLCNFNVIPSTIPFVEELQLIFGISRRLKVEKRRLANQEGAELAAEEQTGCQMEAELARDVEANEAEKECSVEGAQDARQDISQLVTLPASSAAAAVASPSKPTIPPSSVHQSPSCAVRESWHHSLHSSLVV